MADFRRWIFALAVVALLAGFTVPASAQAPPFQCIANAGVPPIVRGEGLTELVGDLTLNCNGGVPTPAGQIVPPVNFTILLNTNITSRLLSSGIYNEALLIIDEPHSAVNPGRNILNCGASGAPDSGPSGPNVCTIVATSNPALTYDGTMNGYGNGTCSGANATSVPPSAGSYGCGRPNVFQGRTGTLQNPNQFNSVTWNGVPLDPPGTTTNRTIRFTNIRADAKFLGVSSTFTTNYIQAQISVNGNTSLAINNPQQIVAFVQLGLIAAVGKTNFTFLQCNDENKDAFANLAYPVIGHGGVLTNCSGFAPCGSGIFAEATSGDVSHNSVGTPTYKFSEGFASSWKAKNIAHILNTTGNGGVLPGGSYWSYAGTTFYPKDQNQNVPGAIYNTESGFMYPGSSATLDTGAVDPAAPNNPPFGIGTVPVTSTANALHNGTKIDNAGIADQGTRLALQLSSIPNGATVLVPTLVYLNNGTLTNFSGAGVGVSGVMVLTSTDANGAGAYSPPTTIGTTQYQAVSSSGLIVYEILFADPFSLESANVPIVVAYASNLAQNLPQPGVTAQVAGSFAPFYTTAAAHNPSSSLPVPRFVPGLVPANLFSVSKCACDMLFPYVASAAGYDTGIAIANTSLDPGAAFGFAAVPQAGSVEFWYYGIGASGGAPPAPQCTNSTSPGTCPGTTNVPAGQVLTYVLSSGGGSIGAHPNGLDNRAAGFIGYIIAQAQFQYCHAFAFIGPLGGGPLTGGISEGYIALILDNIFLPARTPQAAEILGH